MRSLLLTLAAVALLSAPLASAQAPGVPNGAPIYTVEVLNAPAEFPALAANSSASAPFQVTLTLGNVICANAVTIPVTLAATASGAPAFLTVAVEPSVINMTIDQGAYGHAPVGQSATSTGDASVVATITGNITANASVEVTITATAPAPPGPPAGCQGAGAVPSATSAPAVVYANMTAPPPPPEPTPEPEESPGFGAVAALAAVAAAVLLARRKKA